MKIELPKKITRAGVNKVLRQLRANTRAHIKAEISALDKRSVFARKQLESLLEDWPTEGADNRKFPADRDFQHRVLIERQSPLFTFNAPDCIGDEPQISSPGLTNWYVAEFCRLNRLAGMSENFC